MAISDHDSNLQIWRDVTSNFISTFCGDMFSFGLGLMLLHATGLSLSFGLSLMIMPIITLLGLVPVGNLVDHYPRKPIMVISLTGRIVALIIYALVINSFHGTGKILPTVCFLIINYLSVNVSTTAYTAAVKELVNPGHIQRLKALTQSGVSFAAIFSNVAAASLFVILGFNAFIWFQLGAHLIALLLLLSMKFHEELVANHSESPQLGQLAQFKQGLTYLLSHPFLKSIIFIACFINFIFAVLIIGLPFLIVHHLHAGAMTLAILNACWAVGMLVGNLLISMMPEIKHLASMLTISFLTLSVSLTGLGVLLSLSSDRLTLQLLGGACQLIIGLALAFINTPFSVYQQKTIPSRLLGRVSSTQLALNTASVPLGSLVYSFIFQIFPSGSVFTISGVVLTIFAILTIPTFMGIKMPSTVVSDN
ncbi:transporter, major facilitator family protein [Lentilactobacillus parafarraginis F0439]|uniref:Transporter, major facilitator family protein n=1 Tax=Lentilactobacillus parafarraginis F0439 TaxID=797515 RepID=G9ZLU7_9LACO|nr:MFS transporter [Lentilactobacillus parafarraginis]EHM00180.1 transporter, major facilitator family protein [Lentilactobacillus parafarraginis F0439]